MYTCAYLKAQCCCKAVARSDKQDSSSALVWVLQRLGNFATGQVHKESCHAYAGYSTHVHLCKVGISSSTADEAKFYVITPPLSLITSTQKWQLVCKSNCNSSSGHKHIACKSHTTVLSAATTADRSILLLNICLNCLFIEHV